MVILVIFLIYILVGVLIILMSSILSDLTFMYEDGYIDLRPFIMIYFFPFIYVFRLISKLIKQKQNDINETNITKRVFELNKYKDFKDLDTRVKVFK